MPNGPFTPEQIAQILEEFFKTVGTRQYIGSRYVPIFGRKDEDSIEWDNTDTYEPLTIVLYQGNSYTSRQYVPVGVEITNQEFWALTGNYNAQVEQYRRETAAVKAQIDAVEDLIPAASFSDNNTVKDYIDAGDATLETEITNISDIIPASSFDDTNTVKDYIDSISRVIPFLTVADMIASTAVKSGFVCHTDGFNNADDNGGAFYRVSDSGIADGALIIELDNGLYAHLLIPKEAVTPEMFNVSNGVAQAFEKALSTGKLVCGSNKSYELDRQITLPEVVKIEKCTFDCTNVNGAFARNVKSAEIELSKCTFINAKTRTTQNGYSLDAACALNADVATITDCVAYDNDGNGIIVYNDNSAASLEKIIIRDCVAYDNGATGNTGIGIGSYVNTNALDSFMSIEGCKAYDNANSGIGAHGVNNTTISNCLAFDNKEHGFVIMDVVGAAIVDCVSYDNTKFDLRIQGNAVEPYGYCRNVSVSGNVFKNGGIQIGYDCSFIQIVGNIIKSDDTAVSPIELDHAEVPSHDILIKGNTIETNRPLYPFTYKNGFYNVFTSGNIINGARDFFGGSYAGGEVVARKFANYRPSGYSSVKTFDVTDVLNNISTADTTYTNGLLETTGSGKSVLASNNFNLDTNAQNLTVYGRFSFAETPHTGNVALVLRIGDANNAFIESLPVQTTLHNNENASITEIAQLIDIASLLAAYPAAEKLTVFVYVLAPTTCTVHEVSYSYGSLG